MIWQQAIINESSFEEHINCLELLFEATRKHNLKSNTNKCCFAVRVIKVLGRMLDEEGDRHRPILTVLELLPKTLS